MLLLKLNLWEILGHLLPWQILKVIKETLELFLKEAAVKVVFELLVPEGANVDFWTLGYIDHLVKDRWWEICLEMQLMPHLWYRPHESTIHSHQLLVVNLNSFPKLTFILLFQIWLKAFFKPGRPCSRQFWLCPRSHGWLRWISETRPRYPTCWHQRGEQSWVGFKKDKPR